MERELHRTGVQTLRRVVEQEPAAGHDAAGIDRQPDARRRLEAEVEIERAEIAVLERQRRERAHAIERRRQRSDFRADARAHFEVELRVGRPDGDVETIDLEPANRQVGRQIHFRRLPIPRS